MDSVYFTDEHQAFRSEVRRFVVHEVAPHASEWEASGRIPREIFVRMGELGFLGVTAPEAYGGSGADLFFGVVLLEELPRSMMGGFCAAVSVQQFMATPHILRAGSEELKQRYVVPSVAGRKVGALAITEPDAGSDVASIRTTAVRDGDHFVVNGAKTFITNGAEGDFLTLAVRTGGKGAAGISLLAVDGDTPGVRVANRLAKLGWHASDTAEIVFEDARVPVDRLIGGENQGFALIMESFGLERLCSAAIAVGSADVALEHTLRYMAERHAFGRPLSRFQALRHRLADLASELEAARQLAYHTAWRLERGLPAIRESAMAKLVCTELGKRVADECLQLFGGYGFMEEYPVARFYRDARGATITAGTSEIMREIVSRTLIDDFAPATVPPPRHGAMPGRGPVSEEERKVVTVEQVMRSLSEGASTKAMDDCRGTFHFTFRGADKPEWTVRMDGTECAVEEGLQGEADCRLAMEEKTFLGIQDGSVNPQAAFLMGKIKVSNLPLMMRFAQVFWSG
jgi:alkylation response protein AidB-like acyl-CoA dehydrogenase/putative sterol carrier protein